MTRQTVELASVSHDPASHSHALVCGISTFIFLFFSFSSSPSNEYPPPAQASMSAAWPQRRVSESQSRISFPLSTALLRSDCHSLSPGASWDASHGRRVPHPSGPQPYSLFCSPCAGTRRQSRRDKGAHITYFHLIKKQKVQVMFF